MCNVVHVLRSQDLRYYFSYFFFANYNFVVPSALNISSKVNSNSGVLLLLTWTVSYFNMLCYSYPLMVYSFNRLILFQ